MKSLLNLLILVFGLMVVQHSLASQDIIQPRPAGKQIQKTLPLTSEELAWIKAHPVIRVSIKNGWMPVEFQLENEKHRGISIDYLKQISQLTGLQFKLDTYQDRPKPKEVEVISSISNAADVEGYQRLSTPHLVIPYAIYINKYVPAFSGASSLEAFKNARVAVYRHGNIGSRLQAIYPHMKLVYVDIADEAFDGLNNGQIDAYIGNEIVIDYHIEYHRLPFSEKIGVTPFNTEISMAVAEEQPVLASILERAIIAIGTNNANIVQPWRARPPAEKVFIETGTAILSIVCILLLYQFWRFYRRAQHREAEVRQQIWRQANYDYLTQLPNRYLLHQSLEEAIHDCQAAHKQLGLLLIDLDGFKDVNDIAGHAVGDRLLQNAATRIQSCVRAGDTTAKLGGDEFVVVVPNIKDMAILHEIGKKIVETIRSPFHIDDKQHFVTASIGIAVFPNNCDSAEELMMFADQALYAAKRAGKNQYQFFTQVMQQEIKDRISLTRDLRSAIDHDELHLVYQPIYRLHDLALIKAEALIRWEHPTRGSIPPSVFIPIAEESGFIIELGKWIFDEVLKDLSKINPISLQGMEIGLNISPVQFAHPHHLLEFIKRLEHSSIPCERFCFEITEGLLLEPSKTTEETLKAVKRSGIKLSIDDFGTGYSALGYLKKYQIDYVKIDKSFIKNLEVDNYDFILCRSIIQMAHELNMELIAEGVENSQQENILKVMHCDYIQGFLHGRPGLFAALFEPRRTSATTGRKGNTSTKFVK